MSATNLDALCPAQPPEIPTLKDKFGDDDWVLKACADWRAARAQMQKNWAEHNLANGWGTLPDAHIKLDSDPLSECISSKNCFRWQSRAPCCSRANCSASA